MNWPISSSERTESPDSKNFSLQLTRLRTSATAQPLSSWYLEQSYDPSGMALDEQGSLYQSIARHFKVSSLVAARRSLDIGLISREMFFEFYSDYRDNELHDIRRGESDGGNFWRTQRWRIGPRFGTAVARAVKEGRLPYREAYGLTGIRGETFERMPRQARPSAVVVQGALLRKPSTYVLDANVFVAAYQGYYAPNLCPGFWDVLEHFSIQGNLFSIDRVRAELIYPDRFR